jgi:hypothetical protein
LILLYRAKIKAVSGGIFSALIHGTKKAMRDAFMFKFEYADVQKICQYIHLSIHP